MTKTVYIIIIIYFVIANNIFTQDYSIGVQRGENMNFVSIQSDYWVNKSIEIVPKKSFNAGVNFQFKKEKKGAILYLDYFRLYNQVAPEFKVTANDGVTYYTANTYIVNHIFKVSPTLYLKVFSDFYISAGLSTNIDLKSNLKIESDLPIVDGNYNDFPFYNYRSITLSIPIIVGYSYDDFGIYLLLDKGFMDRLSGDNFSNEINNIISLNVSYRFLNF